MLGDVMGSRASSRPRLVAEDTAWTEAAGEAAVLAEFADESAIVQASAPAVAELEPYQRPYRGLRLLNPHTPMREIVRMVLVGCLSAMAVGASFAIGFGYVWSDRSGAPTSPAPDEVATPRPYQGWWWPTLPQASPPRVASTPAPQKATPPPPMPQAARSSGDKPAPSVQASKSSSAQASSAVSTETTVANRNAARAPTADEAEVPSAAVEEESTLPSQPMLSGESGAVAGPVAPLLTVTPYPGPAATEFSTGANAVHRVEADAVRQAIERYAAAYSHKDVGAMALVWPSVDVPGVARAFESVDRQALTLGECRVTTAGNLATAVCPGQVRYVGRVGSRQMQERQGTWTIALERRGEAWQFVRLNVR